MYFLPIQLKPFLHLTLTSFEYHHLCHFEIFNLTFLYIGSSSSLIRVISVDGFFRDFRVNSTFVPLLQYTTGIIGGSGETDQPKAAWFTHDFVRVLACGFCCFVLFYFCDSIIHPFTQLPPPTRTAGIQLTLHRGCLETKNSSTMIVPLIWCLIFMGFFNNQSFLIKVKRNITF